MDWWANIVATLSFLLASSAFIWAVKTFGKAKPRLEVELSVSQPSTIGEALGVVGPTMLEIFRATASEDAQQAFDKLGTDVIPYLRKAVPEWVEGSPLLSKVLPSLATMFSSSPLLDVAIRNQGVTDVSVVAVEIGSGMAWGNVEGRAIFGRATDAFPVVVRAGSDIEVSFPIEKVEVALAGLKLEWRNALIRVRTTTKRVFIAQLGGVDLPAKEVAT